jgi:hypothetical protein
MELISDQDYYENRRRAEETQEQLRAREAAERLAEAKRKLGLDLPPALVEAARAPDPAPLKNDQPDELRPPAATETPGGVITVSASALATLIETCSAYQQLALRQALAIEELERRLGRRLL